MGDMAVCTTYYDPDERRVGPLDFSAARFGIGVTNFGAHQKFEGFLRTKLVPLREFAKDRTEDMLLFLDGNDTILTNPLKKLVESWDGFGGKVVIGGELKCWPYPFHEEPMRAKAPQDSFCFMDTGLIFGKRKDVIDILDTVIGSVEGYRLKYPGYPARIIEDDVGLFMLNYVDGKIDIAIDYKCEIIVPMKEVTADWFEIEDGHLRLLKTGTTPHVVHCNGHRCIDKKRMRDISRRLLGVQKTKRAKEAS